MWWCMLVAVMVAGARADVESAVRVLSQYGQLVTSSTLVWVEAREGAEPEHAVHSGPDGPAVCRVLADGLWAAGALRGSRCAAVLHGRVLNAADYQVLQNVEGGGRLGWQPWDKYRVVGPGSVAVAVSEPTAYVARRGPDQLGQLDRSLGLLGKIVAAGAEDGAPSEFETGEVLVETEPARYELADVTLQHWRARAHRHRMLLGRATLRNEDAPRDSAAPARVDAVIAYEHNRTVGWGHGHAILTGLPVSGRLASGANLEPFRWAIDNTTDHKSTYPVEALLEPGHACNVTLYGNWTEANVPYEARLIAVFTGGERRERALTGVRREVGLRDVRPEFGPVYRLADGSLVPTTTTTTTPAPPTTTSTTAATTTTTTTAATSPRGVAAPDPMQKRTRGGNSTEMQADGPGAAREPAGGGATRPALATLTLATVAALAARA